VFSQLGNYAKGDKVKVYRVRQDGWAEVAAPPNAVLWVHKNYLAPPTTVTVVNTDDQEKPPEKPPVEPPKPGETGVTRIAIPTAEGGTKPPPVAGATEQWEPDPDSYQIHRIATDPQKGPLEYLGVPQAFAETAILIPLKDKHTPWKHALAVKINNTYYPLGYVDPKGKDVTTMQWREVAASGTRRWVRGWPRPVIELTAIRLD
jgi:hypothetical protein